MSLYLGETPICGGIEGNQLNNPFSLLDYKFSEYEITNASWLRSNGQYNSGTTYADVYNLLLQIYNGTVTKAGVSVKLSTETYADTDFVLNTSDTTFRLPLKVALASGKAVVGNGLSLGLTDGTSNFAPYGRNGNGYDFMIASIEGYGKSVGTAGNTFNQIATKVSAGITTDPTKSGIETSANGLYLYFYVGETVQDANLINAGQVLNDVANLKAHYIVETYVNGTSWYRVYSDGWCEQGGIYDNGSNSRSYTTNITFLKNFKNADYNISAVAVRLDNSIDCVTALGVYDKTVSGITIRTFGISSTDLSQYLDWVAMGYIS